MVRVGRDMRFCLPNTLPAETAAMGPWATLWAAGLSWAHPVLCPPTFHQSPHNPAPTPGPQQFPCGENLGTLVGLILLGPSTDTYFLLLETSSSFGSAPLTVFLSLCPWHLAFSRGYVYPCWPVYSFIPGTVISSELSVQPQPGQWGSA